MNRNPDGYNPEGIIAIVAISAAAWAAVSLAIWLSVGARYAPGGQHAPMAAHATRPGCRGTLP